MSITTSSRRRRHPRAAGRVVVTGIGLATPLGHGMDEFSRGLFGAGAPVDRVHSRYAAPVPGMRVGGGWQAALSHAEQQRNDRSVQLAWLAGRRALDAAGWSPAAAAEPDSPWHDCAVFAGNSSGPAESLSHSHAQLQASGRVPAATLLRCMPSATSASLGMRFGLRGATQTITSACASSTVALGQAMQAIRHRYLRMALVGGTEAPFADGTLKAWEALRLLAPCGDDPSTACRPFDARRGGLVLGEAAAFFVLEDEDHARQRGAAVQAVLQGYSAAADAHQWTVPCVSGQARTMRLALQDAGLTPDEIGLVNAYGTGTVVGDGVEAQSIAQVFGTGRDAPWVYSSKSLHGHALGASGALELAAVIATLQQQRIPATRNLREPDDLPLNLVYGAARPLGERRHALSNSFAFGGSNACLVVSNR
ncbi:MAG: beta-ketoacyl-[acyl-carrier-protein] synthase family protein [Proteobacteria bacterium]|nr:beta-ketoacyl-[acyl-carrier-protein] synthase family protein [Pseudomonadota bacterium]